jgi:hypothetical protein
VLSSYPELDVRVFTVWLPIVFTDFARPSTGVMSRMTDPRVQQLWDPDHLLAREITLAAQPPHPQPDCCEIKGIFWDVAAVYRKGARWDERLPPAVFLNGPVTDVVQGLEAALKTEANPSWNDSSKTFDTRFAASFGSLPSRSPQSSRSR